MFKHLRQHFISGLLVLAPLFLTTLIIVYLVRIADAFVVNPVFSLLPFDMDVTFKVLLAKLAIAAVVIVLVTLIGLGAEKIFMKEFMSGAETILKGIPVLNKVYGSVKDIAQAFFGGNKGIFKKVVFIEYPRKGVYSLGFVTQEKPWEAGRVTGRELVTVFVPSPPNPATGYFIFVPKEEVTETRLTIEDGLKLVISGGAAIPELLQLTP